MQLFCAPQNLPALTDAVSPLCQELLASEPIYRSNESDGSHGQDAIDSDLAKRVSSLVQALEDYEDILRIWTTVDGQELPE